MYNQSKPKFFLLFLLCLHYSFNVSFAGEDKSPTISSAGKNPFTVKDSVIRYWNQQISNKLPKPSFLISKASPLTAVDAAFLVKLADQNALSTHLPFFCSSANLACFTALSPSLEEPSGDANFTSDDIYIKYGGKPTGDANFAVDDIFIKYGGKPTGDANFAVDDIFIKYGGKPTGDANVTDDLYSYDQKPRDANVTADGKPIIRWVEPGIFFRELNLKQGTVMPMPDIRDKMPKRSFLPQSLSSKLPFSTSKLSQLKQIFHASENSSMESILKHTIGVCERAPSQGETKRCVGSIVDMINFAVSVLGRNVVVRSIEGVKGSKKDVMVGVVKGINGGKITRSVSCHQSLYPYLVYYCHSLPKVRVYEAEILDVKTKEKINKGTAICHVDTSSWSPGHVAFAALGSSPGKIEVCHWIFEAAMTWATAD